MLTFSISTFFDKIRPFFGGKLTQGQVLNMQTLLALYSVQQGANVEAAAYILATVRHEAGASMAPVEEIGRGAGHDYGKMFDAGTGPGKRVPYTSPAQLYYGRGHVQLTWRGNYANMGKLVGADLLNHPELMLTVAVSAQVAITGMVQGSFTGRKLSQYFGPDIEADPVQARRIINGTKKGETLPDKAELVAKYYDYFRLALEASHAAAVVKLQQPPK